ncbi:hypothetical protein GQ600_19610 [Phytophthora cactorum]|nr:hypothetical protein GQ600_19610 [Phytophthora cactorum]
MKAFIHRMNENAVPPRLIWSNLLRAPDVPKPVLGYPSYAQVQRSVKYSRWLQGRRRWVSIRRKWRGRAVADFGNYDIKTTAKHSGTAEP